MSYSLIAPAELDRVQIVQAEAGGLDGGEGEWEDEQGGEEESRKLDHWKVVM